MNVNLGEATAGVAVAISVFDDYVSELMRLGRIPSQVAFTRTIGGTPLDIIIFLDPPPLTMVKPAGGAPYIQLKLTGPIEARPAGHPESTPFVNQLDAAVKLVFGLSADDERVLTVTYGGVDGTPSPPQITNADIDGFFQTGDIANELASTRVPLAAPLIEGLNTSLFPDLPGGGAPPDRPAPADWSAAPTLMPSGDGTVDSLAVTVGLPGTNAAPAVVESFVAEQMGMGVAYNRDFLDLMLARGADAKEGTSIDGTDITRLRLFMSASAIEVDGAAWRDVQFPFPNVDFTFKGPMVPHLVRGTTAIAFDMDGVEVDVSDFDEAFYTVLKWLTTIGAGAMLFTGWGTLTAVGILLWLTVVQKAWAADLQISEAPDTLRDTLAAALGAELAALSDSLDDDTALGALRIDSTPDSLVLVEGNMVLLAQVLVVPVEAKMRSAEYSKKLRRFCIFELDDGRRFRAQELARLMKLGKVTVPGFHQADGNYLRANPDDAEANNLLRRFKSNPTTEPVVKSRRH